MESIDKLLNRTLNEELGKIIISNPRKKNDIVKIKARPVIIKGELRFQLEKFTETQVFHENLEKWQGIEAIKNVLVNFRQMQIYTESINYSVLVSKKGKATIKVANQSSQNLREELTHNRNKNYILEEGVSIPFLVDTGIMTKEGKVVKSKYHKYRQINRFLEFINDVLPLLDRNKEIRIIDFGCGKSHLTFATYYFLHEIKGYDVKIIGLDLKESVINSCNKLARRYGYNGLNFYVGDIASYEDKAMNEDAVMDEGSIMKARFDIVISLHACDTATDYALAKAIKWQARVILAVPCCQHELSNQIKNDTLQPLLKFGIIKERFASLVTDSLRAEYLECMGYKAQVLEFIDMEHTPKNILIRAVRKGSLNYQKRENLRQYESLMHIRPMLGRLLDMEDDND